MADMLRVAGSFAGHDRTQTKSQTPVTLGAGQETGARMRAEPAETEVRQRCRGLLALKPARVFTGAEAKQIRKRPPLRSVDSTGSGGEPDVDAPAFPGAPGRIAEQRRQRRTNVDPGVLVRSHTSRIKLSVPRIFPKRVVIRVVWHDFGGGSGNRIRLTSFGAGGLAGSGHRTGIIRGTRLSWLRSGARRCSTVACSRIRDRTGLGSSRRLRIVRWRGGCCIGNLRLDLHRRLGRRRSHRLGWRFLGHRVSPEDQLNWPGGGVPDRMPGDGRGTSTIVPAKPAEGGSGRFHAEADQIGRRQRCQCRLTCLLRAV